MAFPDAHEEVDIIIAQGDLVAARQIFTGTHEGQVGHHAPTGRRVRACYLAMYRVVENRIAEAWAEWDNTASRTQLGLTEA